MKYTLGDAMGSVSLNYDAESKELNGYIDSGINTKLTSEEFEMLGKLMFNLFGVNFEEHT